MFISLFFSPLCIKYLPGYFTSLIKLYFSDNATELLECKIRLKLTSVIYWGWGLHIFSNN